jgi:uncharacterized protein (TIGR04141 family)
MAERSNKLTVGLIKPDLTDFAQIVKPETIAIEIAGVGTFYMEASHPRPPSWITDFFGTTLGNNLQLITSSAKGVLLVRVPDNEGERIFSVIFGHGRYLLVDGALEERFGLLVVLNSIDPDNWRSIDKTALGSVPKQSREQVSRESAATSFGIDIEQDLVSQVTGKSIVERFGRTISGRDTFAATAKFDVNDVSAFLAEALTQYKSDSYKERFDWIDQIKDVRSKSSIAELDAILIARLMNKELEHIWMAPPEVIDWSDVKGFRYIKKISQDVPDLEPLAFLEAANGIDLSIDWLKSAKILLISAQSDNEAKRWPAYQCIYAEIEINGTMHVLNAGKWYQVATDFTQIVQADFASIPDSAIQLPDYAHHGNENAYNVAIAAALADSHCLDADLISHGGGHSKIEFCDVITADKTLLHVKRYSGSAQLSHLFSQGVVSGELFANDADFRIKLNDKLPQALKLADPSIKPKLEEYSVVFTIISKSPNALNLPFFSKISFRNARRRLEGYGYKVYKKKVRAIGNEAA